MSFGAIRALPTIYRAPVMLRDIQGLSTEEASAMLRVKDQTLKSRLHRGRLILRKQLADFAGGLRCIDRSTGRLRAGGAGRAGGARQRQVGRERQVGSPTRTPDQETAQQRH